MSKESIDPPSLFIERNSIRADTPDWQEGYEQGLLSGYTKSIVLIRHLQRALPPSNASKGCQRNILKKAMELISKEIK